MKQTLLFWIDVIVGRNVSYVICKFGDVSAKEFSWFHLFVEIKIVSKKIITGKRLNEQTYMVHIRRIVDFK